MNEQDVRALVREAIERHLGRPERTAKVEPYRVDTTLDDGPPVLVVPPSAGLITPATFS